VKSKLFALVLEIVLVNLLCAMSGLDAPEYVRCEDIGVCEFLEIFGEVSDTHRFNILMVMPVNQTIKDLVRKLGVHCEIFIRSFRRSSSVRTIPFIINRYLNSFQDIVFFLPRTDDKVVINIESISPSRGSNLPSESLKFLTTSIIRS
jgi:hypothetical protein